jgi:hypothetical protein
MHIPHGLPFRELIERRLCDIDMSMIEERTEVSEKEREDECSDMSSIDIGICHDDDTTISELRIVKCLTDRSPDRDDEVLDLRIREYFIDASLLGIEDLSFEWEDRLKLSIPTGFRRSSRRVSLDDIELTFTRILRGAVCEFPRETRTL